MRNSPTNGKPTTPEGDERGGGQDTAAPPVVTVGPVTLSLAGPDGKRQEIAGCSPGTVPIVQAISQVIVLLRQQNEMLAVLLQAAGAQQVKVSSGGIIAPG